MKIFRPFYVSLCCIGLLSCNKSEQIPAYLDIQPFTVDATGGAAWQKITEAWVYVDGDLLGAYSLPASVPVLANGDVKIQLFPGIKENGISATPSVYNIMRSYVAAVKLISGQSTSVTPNTKYVPDVIFPWQEDLTTFDGSATINLKSRDSDTTTSFTLSNVDGFEGKHLLMSVDTAHALIEIETESVKLPTQSERQSWLELHYKNDMPFSLWIIGDEISGETAPSPIFQFNNSDSWKKIYINLTPFVTGAGAPGNYKLDFRVGLPRDESGNFKQLKGKVMVDNIRLVHF